MREERDFPDWAGAWTQEEDDRLRAALGSLRQDVDAGGLPDVRFVMRRAGRARQRAIVGVAAGAAAVVGLSWFGFQAMDDAPSTAPADNGSVTTQYQDDQQSTEASTERSTDGETDAAPVDRADLATSAGSAPGVELFAPPSLWSSQAFTGGAATSAGIGEFETTALFDCDPDDVYAGDDAEGTFGVMGIWADGSAFGTQRVRVLDSAQAAESYVNDMDAALAGCVAPAEADNIDLVVEPLELSGAYRFTTTFRDGTEPMTDFYYIVQHDGTPEAASTFRLTDYSGTVGDADAAAELERLAGLVTSH